MGKMSKIEKRVRQTILQKSNRKEALEFDVKMNKETIATLESEIATLLGLLEDEPKSEE